MFKHSINMNNQSAAPTSRIKPVGIFHRLRRSGVECFSCTTSTYIEENKI